MDPVDLVRLMHELRTVDAETETISVDELVPGHVLASSSEKWRRHVVTSAPLLVSEKTARVPVRHLHGGHNITPRLRRATSLTVYRQRLSVGSLSAVPVVPRAFVPDEPTVGDRVYHQFTEVEHLGENRCYQYDGSEWVFVEDKSDGYRARKTVTVFKELGSVMRRSTEVSPDGWYTYVPAGHRPHLYIDGTALPARTAEQLQLDDVIRIPGGGRLQVVDLVRRPQVTTITLRLVSRSFHALKHFTYQYAEGTVLVHEDSGRTRALYPTEARPHELITASELRPMDTVISGCGTSHTCVDSVEDVWHLPVSASVRVEATSADGRTCRHTQMGNARRFVLLHRSDPVHAFAAEPLLPVRSHA
ncbi:hypothetical protein [Streptomyces sp. cg35]|uniref:hypothetical protein n=1 Tax=Streptomyces sp. cg35 TaxID=3421650 RepID=UPI003D167966